MKVFAITVLLVLSGITASAADTTMLKLMQKVIELEVPKYYQYFYLLDEPAKGETDHFDLESDSKSVLNIPFNEFKINVKTDTTSFKWCELLLPRAKCVDNEHLPKHVYSMVKVVRIIACTSRAAAKRLNLKNNDTIAVFSRPNASQKQVDKALKKATATHNAYCEKANSALPLEERNYFRFSKPFFSNDRRYAYIEVSRADGGSRCIFKNTNGNWDLVRETRVAY
ncbi:hypothetical protein KXQ82_00385 [Mucilaginibacter sp. HMF5004]|uniref:hypothetical protein n=1 Tax=Mucilaginibacter rivuli TaxID=2857527 RepID=UPI001C5DFD27|nr:hypothetical protein [Mucilaginibacter rivuli]MBW4888143.1 hypothetical protein [Mucilaginibacter rivuli]